jgi:AcrR family transcriptional regulator
MVFSEAVNEAGPDAGWRTRSLDRQLASARARSVKRLERLVAAARDLANETGHAGFTVQQVCVRARMSLKGFYACFAGKDELLVALIEEDSRTGAQVLADLVATHDDPEARLRAAVVGVLELLTIPGALGYAGVLLGEHRRLTESRPAEMRGALAPILDLLERELAAGAGAGVIAPGDHARDALTVFALVLEGIHDVTVEGADPLEEAAYLWRFCSGGLEGAASTNERDSG